MNVRESDLLFDLGFLVEFSTISMLAYWFPTIRYLPVTSVQYCGVPSLLVESGYRIHNS